MYPRKPPGFSNGKMKPFGSNKKKIRKGIFSWVSWKTYTLHTPGFQVIRKHYLVKLQTGVCNFATAIKAN